MSATGGKHWTGRTALLLAVAAVAAGLAGCEYADDVGTLAGRFRRSAAGRIRPGRRCRPGIRNSLPPKPAICWNSGPSSTAHRTGLLFGGSGGIGDTSSGGFSTSGLVRRAGQYKVTAACVGAPDAHLSVTQGARQGGTLLELSLDCGSAAEALVDLVPGSVSAHLVRYGGSVPGPGTGAVAGIRISFSGPGQ